MTGWPPNKSAVPVELLPYWSFTDEILTYEGVLVKAHQVIIPAVLRREMLQKIRRAHQGPESSIRCPSSIFRIILSGFLIFAQTLKLEPSVPFLVATIATKDRKCISFLNLEPFGINEPPHEPTTPPWY